MAKEKNELAVVEEPAKKEKKVKKVKNDLPSMDKKKFNPMVFIHLSIFVVLISIIAVSLSTILGKPKNALNGHAVERIEVENESNFYELTTFKISDIKLKIIYKDKSVEPTTIDCDEKHLTESSLLKLKNMDSRKTIITDIDLFAYESTYNYELIFYYIPTIRDIYTITTKDGNDYYDVKYIDYGVFPNELLTNRGTIDALDTKLNITLEEVSGTAIVYYKDNLYYRQRVQIFSNDYFFPSTLNEKIQDEIPQTSTFITEDTWRKNFSWSLSKHPNDNSKYYIYYYFKFDPIRYRVLVNDNINHESNDLFVMSDAVLGCSDYKPVAQEHNNDYADSVINTYLTENVYDLFLKPYQDNLLTATINNQNGVIPSDGSEHLNTEGVMYIPSVDDLTNPLNYFKSDISIDSFGDYASISDDKRVGKYSDYSLLSAYPVDDSEGIHDIVVGKNHPYAYARYWTRTYHSTNVDFVYLADRNGNIRSDTTGRYFGVRPVMHLNLRVSE